MPRNPHSTKKSVRRRRPGRPTAAEPSGEQLREAVIEAARRVYADNGYQRSSVELFLQAANISRPTFYRLFSDKREVIAELLGRANLDLATSLPAAVASARSLGEAVNLGLDAYFDWARRQSPAVGAFYREINDRDSPASELRERTLAMFIAVIGQQAEKLGYPRLDPGLIEALLHVAEYVGGNCFSARDPSEQNIRHARKIAGRIILASVLCGIDNSKIPPLTDFLV